MVKIVFLLHQNKNKYANPLVIYIPDFISSGLINYSYVLMGNQESGVSISSRLCGCNDNDLGYQADGTLLKQKDREFWIKNLRMQGIPEKTFWEKNRQVKHPSFQQIAKDIVRSFPNEQFFQDPANFNRFEILLRKFALYFPKLGYTQGLNFISGYLLIAGFTDDQAFETLVGLALHEKLLLIGLYEDSFPLTRVYCSLFWKLLDNRLPKTSAKIRSAQVPDQAWIFQWFLSFFLYSFPVQFIKRFMDYILCKKQCSMVTIAIGIVYCLRKQIIEMVQPDQFEFFAFFDKLRCRKFCQTKISIDKVISYANSICKREVDEALHECKIKNNIYYVYLMRFDDRREIWNSVIDKLARERKMFRLDPKSKEYKRDKNMVSHLERFLRKKSTLYFSKAQSKGSQLKTSNFTVDLAEEEYIASTKFTEPSSPLCNPFCKQVPTHPMQFSRYLRETEETGSNKQHSAYFSSKK